MAFKRLECWKKKRRCHNRCSVYWIHSTWHDKCLCTIIKSHSKRIWLCRMPVSRSTSLILTIFHCIPFWATHTRSHWDGSVWIKNNSQRAANQTRWQLSISPFLMRPRSSQPYNASISFHFIQYFNLMLFLFSCICERAMHYALLLDWKCLLIRAIKWKRKREGEWRVRAWKTQTHRRLGE